MGCYQRKWNILLFLLRFKHPDKVLKTETFNVANISTNKIILWRSCIFFMSIQFHTVRFISSFSKIYIYIYTGVGQNNRNTWQFQTNLFSYGFLISALTWNLALYSSLLTVFEETGFSTWSLSSALIFGAVFLWSFQTICESSGPYHTVFAFFQFCFCVEVFPSFSNAVITFETVLLAKPNDSAVFVTLAPAIWAPTNWPLLKSDKSAILLNIDSFLLMISLKKTILVK